MSKELDWRPCTWANYYLCWSPLLYLLRRMNEHCALCKGTEILVLGQFSQNSLSQEKLVDRHGPREKAGAHCPVASH